MFNASFVISLLLAFFMAFLTTMVIIPWLIDKLKTAGLIGKDFLNDFITTLDYINNEIIIEPLKDNYEDKMFSIGLCVKKEGDKFIVRGIWQNSPADKHGIKVHDAIIKLNNFPNFN